MIYMKMKKMKNLIKIIGGGQFIWYLHSPMFLLLLIKVLNIYWIYHIPKLSDSFSIVVVILYNFTGDTSFQDLTNKGDIEIDILYDSIGGK